MDHSFGHDVGVESIAKVYRVDIVTIAKDSVSNAQYFGAIRLYMFWERTERDTYHSKSLYIMVKKTCRKRLTAFISTARRYSHASPDIIAASWLCKNTYN